MENKLNPVRQAAMAERVLADDDFCDMIQNMKWEAFTQWTISESQKEREEIHARLTGVLSVQAELEMLLQRQIIEEKKNQETEE